MWRPAVSKIIVFSAILAAFASGCGSHAAVSGGSQLHAQRNVLPPLAAVRSTPAAVHTSSSVLRVTNLDAGTTKDVSQLQTLNVTNGARLRVDVSAPDVTAGNVHTDEADVSLTRAGDGQWTATMRFIDSSNPPKEHTALNVVLQSASGPRTLRVPIQEEHQ